MQLKTTHVAPGSWGPTGRNYSSSWESQNTYVSDEARLKEARDTGECCDKWFCKTNSMRNTSIVFFLSVIGTVGCVTWLGATAARDYDITAPAIVTGIFATISTVSCVFLQVFRCRAK